MNSLLNVLRAPFRLLPERFPRVLLYSAFVVAFLLVVFFDNRYSQLTFPPAWRLPILDGLTYIVDPLLCHATIYVICAVLIWRYLSFSHPKESLTLRLGVSIGLPVVLIATSYALEVLVLKPAFKYPRPGIDAQPLGDPWLTSMLRWLTPSSDAIANQDVPSGFALRQITLFYLTEWIVSQIDNRQQNPKAWLSRKTTLFLQTINWFMLITVFFSRVYRARHTLFALSVAVGVGTFMFWSFLAFVYAISFRHRGHYRSLLAETFMASMALLIVFIAYSNDAGRWLIFAVVFFIPLGIAYMLPGTSSPESKGTPWQDSSPKL